MEYSATNQSIQWFKRLDEQGELELSPAFQRNPIWDDQQSSYLIDSILNDLPVPEVYTRVITSPEGDATHEIVDGQQRMRAILNFVKNDLVLSGTDVSPQWIGKSWSDFDDPKKQRFWEYKIVVRELGQVSDGEVRDLFRRLNINAVVLNDQELRHARFTGQFISLVEDLANDNWLLNRGVANLQQIRRMEDVEFVSELIVGLMAGPQDKKKTLDDYYEDYEVDFPDKRHWKKTYEQTRSLLDQVFGQQEIREWRGKSDFYTLFLSFGDLVTSATKISASKRSAIKAKLMTFLTQVKQAKRKDNTKHFSKRVHEYTDAVTRAATDLARRNARQKIIDKLIRSSL